MHLIELRSGHEGHPGYRAVAHEMHRRSAGASGGRGGDDAMSTDGGAAPGADPQRDARAGEARRAGDPSAQRTRSLRLTVFAELPAASLAASLHAVAGLAPLERLAVSLSLFAPFLPLTENFSVADELLALHAADGDRRPSRPRRACSGASRSALALDRLGELDLRELRRGLVLGAAGPVAAVTVKFLVTAFEQL